MSGSGVPGSLTAVIKRVARTRPWLSEPADAMAPGAGVLQRLRR